MDSNVEVPPELVEFIKTNSRFIIAGHKEPDGDCIGSQLALHSALVRLGKDAVICSPGPFKRTELRGLAGKFKAVSQVPEFNLEPDAKLPDTKIIIVDCTGRDRTGEIHEFIMKFPCAVIDHHSTVNHPPSTRKEPVYVDANSPSCTLLVYKLIQALGLDITEEEATFLLFGICTDTGFFRHLTEKNSDVFEATAKMIRRGANPKNIFNIINGGKTLSSRILIGKILSRTESYFDGKLLVSYETLEEFNSFGLINRDSDTLYQLLLSVDGVQAALIIRQECAENCTVSLRSVDKIDVEQIASSFGGGGHKNASGLTMKGDISFVKQNMLKLFSDIFDR